MSTTPHLSQLAPGQRRQLDQWLQEFEQSWDESRLGSRARGLPPPEDPLRRAALLEMIKIDLRRRWQSGRHVRLEAYLKNFPELGTADTVPADLILAEYHARRLAGAADPAAIVQRFPRQAREVNQLLARGAESAAPAGSLVPPTTLGGADATHTPQPPALPPELPEQFGRYRILKKLGQGGMGAVYLAHDSQLDRKVALKVPRFRPEDGPEMLERFSREARAAATLSHPNICPVHDVGEINGIHYATMAYIEGLPLSDLIQPGKPLPQRPVAAIVRKLALTLEEAHQRGIIHRDLKPANIMVNRQKEPVVMDFGLARRIGKGEARLTKGGAILGTPAYMSPEQVRGETVDARSDVYSLGVILYELLTGRLPFEGPLAAVLGQILTQEPPPPSAHRADVEPALEAICRKAMAKQTAVRYGSMKDFAAALTQYLKGGAEAAGAPSASGKPRLQKAAAQADEGLATQLLARLVERLDTAAPPSKPPARTPWWVPLAVALVILLAGVVVVFLVLQKPPQVHVEAPPATVVVQLAGLPERLDPMLIFVLDGEVRSRDELSQPLRLPPGDHKLVVRRGDRVIETRDFKVGEKDDRKTVQLPPAADEPRAPEGAGQPPPAGEPSPPTGEPSAEALALIKSLNDEDVKVRREAAQGLGKRGEKAAVPALIMRVADDLWSPEDGNIRPLNSKAAALDAIKVLDKTRMTEALRRAAQSKVPEVRRWACLELREQKDKDAVACLVAVLKDDKAEQVRQAAAESLVTARPPAVAALAAALFDLHPTVRCRAAYTLRELGGSAVPPDVVREVAARAVPALIKRIADPQWFPEDGNIRPLSPKATALDALQVLGKDRATEALRLAAQSTTWEVRRWACRELREQKDKEAVACLVVALKEDPAEEVRAAAAESLVTARPPAVAALVRALFDGKAMVSRQAAITLRELGGSAIPPDVVKEVAEGAVPALTQRVADDHWFREDGNIRPLSPKAMALDALKVLGKEQVTDALLRALSSKTEEVRVWACRELGELKDARAGEGLGKAAASDPSATVRKAAAEALAKPK
jgi:HEAT repeat protein